MVKADEILKLSERMRATRKASSPNTRKGKRLEVSKRQYMAMKGNKREIEKKNIELARQREMKKLRREVNKMTLPEAQRILRRMIRQAKTMV